MFCMNCGTQLPENAKFCFKCGTPQKYLGQVEAPKQIEEPRWDICQIECHATEKNGLFDPVYHVIF